MDEIKVKDFGNMIHQIAETTGDGIHKELFFTCDLQQNHLGFVVLNNISKKKWELPSLESAVALYNVIGKENIMKEKFMVLLNDYYGDSRKEYFKDEICDFLESCGDTIVKICKEEEKNTRSS